MSRKMQVVRVAISGPVATGKTVIAHRLREYLMNIGASAVVIDDHLKQSINMGEDSKTPAEQAKMLRKTVVIIEEETTSTGQS